MFIAQKHSQIYNLNLFFLKLHIYFVLLREHFPTYSCLYAITEAKLQPKLHTV